MKKKLLFVMPSLCAGGGEKSLINLLNQLDYTQYHVDLFLFNQSGVFITALPKQVHILSFPENYSRFIQPLHRSVVQLLCAKRFSMAYARVLFSIKHRLTRNKALAEQKTWKQLKQALNTMPQEYDAAIGYLEKSSIYFVVDQVKAKKKIGWIHTNYGNTGMNPDLDTPFFQQLDTIVTVSDECAKSLKDIFPFATEKVNVIQNIVSPATIKHLATKKFQNPFVMDGTSKNIVTIARLSPEKGIDIAIHACKLLVKRGSKIKWFVIGEGDHRKELEGLIQKNKLEDTFILLGIKENPYPYLEKADLYVQPSRYEGKSIAIEEAKVLCKPIVVTNFQTAKDQIQHGRNGLIASLSPEGVVEKIESVLNDPTVREVLKAHLTQEKVGTEEDIYKLYALL